MAAAKSKSKEKFGLQSGGADKFLTVGELNNKRVDKGFDVVIEATGDKNIFPFASTFVRSGGRIIGLGTPRGFGPITFGQYHVPRNCQIIGAHISGMPQKDESPGLWTYQSEGQLFLELLAENKFAISDLISHQFDPCQASEAYEALKNNDSKLLGAVFDWNAYTSGN